MSKPILMDNINVVLPRDKVNSERTVIWIDDDMVTTILPRLEAEATYAKSRMLHKLLNDQDSPFVKRPSLFVLSSGLPAAGVFDETKMPDVLTVPPNAGGRRLWLREWVRPGVLAKLSPYWVDTESSKTLWVLDLASKYNKSDPQSMFRSHAIAIYSLLREYGNHYVLLLSGIEQRTGLRIRDAELSLSRQYGPEFVGKISVAYDRPGKQEAVCGVSNGTRKDGDAAFGLVCELFGD